MPIYEYVCQACGQPFELLVLSSKAKTSCPHCESPRVERQFSTFAAHSGGAKVSACAERGCPAAVGGATCPGAGGCALSR